MKKFFSIICLALTIISCSNSVQITVTNPTDFDRYNEMVEINASEIGLCCAKKCHSFLLQDQFGNEIAYQVIFNGQEKPKSIIFQANVIAKQSTVYTFKKGIPAKVSPLVFARFVPERKDDFAWENDRAAYRMYGPALANENPSNGVDLWLKRTNELIVDTFYFNELNYHQSYHIDHGKGLDCYKVGDKLGCGGIAPFAFDSLWVGKHYDRYEIIETGALRTTFALEYDHVKVGDKTLKERIEITLDAGAQLNKATVKYSGDTILNMQIAAGIYLHDSIDNYLSDEAQGWAAYAENAISDAGIPSGRNYAAVIVPNSTKIDIQNKTLLVYSPYNQENELTYYFGGGWSKWGYPTDQDWFNATKTTALAIAQPFIVEVK